MKSWFWLLAWCLLLAGCAEMPPPGPAPQRPDRAAIRGFTVQGSFALKLGREGQSGRLAWSHRDGEDRMLVLSPLGQTLASLGADEKGAALELYDGRQFRAAGLDELSAQVFGQPLPLSHFPRWVLGLPGSGIVSRDALGRLATLDEAGWHTEYVEYEGPDAGALPSYLRVSREGVDLKLRLDGWSVLP